ncbi:unnamed protein product [Brassica rapa]|uniref:COBRA C-terminal domain-containing protein n=1 Tax=Brassica campestris TaxID=3711 RepID=A0A8D9H3F7_BRACM|nr:unnamed protein product [Brassica rapa]
MYFFSTTKETKTEFGPGITTPPASPATEQHFSLLKDWKIDGIVNPQYKSGPPVRVDPTGFPDPSGLQATTYAFASWQVICNITKPKPKAAPFCVSYLAFYNDSVIPCNTCGCGDIDTDTCNANARQLLLPPDSLLVPFENRTLKAKVWAKRKHMAFIKKLPCPDNCGISLN